ncbi:MAG: hypothetical protein CME62_13925 [Halobacteriovoraceae bacterium]|nr:hypothetical protein [Halobacteriovoraceae bacterium]
MPLQDAKSLQDQLKARGVEIILNHNDQTCTRGCAVTVEVHGSENDLPVISEIYTQNFQKLAEGHDVNWERMNAVYDPNQAEATCPACGFTFSTSQSECPDCGLVLG